MKKFCITCTYYAEHGFIKIGEAIVKDSNVCMFNAPEDIVTGVKIGRDCRTMRLLSQECGPEGLKHNHKSEYVKRMNNK